MFDLWARGGLTAEKKTLFVRGTDTELKHAKSEFNNLFAGLFRVVGSQVYALTEKPGKNEADPPDYVIGEHVGYYASVAQADNYKGAWTGKGVAFIVYDEFNRQDPLTRNIYANFVNLISTMSRLNPDTICYMLGNKDTFLSDFFVNWDIVPTLDHDEDVLYKVETDGRLDVVLLDMGNAWYRQIGQENSLAWRLGQHDKATAQYMRGDYMLQSVPTVINAKHILPTFAPLRAFLLENRRWIYGRWEKGNALLAERNAPEGLDLPAIALDRISRVSNAKIPTREADNDLRGALLAGLRSGRLYFDGYDGYNAFCECASRWNMDET